MSSNKQYYLFDSGDDRELPISAEEGWKQMQQLLDKHHLPVKNKKYFSFIILALITTAGILFSYQLKNNIPTVAYISQGNLVADNVFESSKTENNSKEDKFSIAKSPTVKNKLLQTGRSENLPGRSEFSLSAGNEPAPAYTNKAVDGLQKNNTSTAENNSLNKFLENTIIGNKQALQDTVTATPAIKNKNRNTHSLQLNVALATNIQLSSNQQNLQPYPFIQAKYNFNKTLYASIGAGLFSPVMSNANAITKAFYQPSVTANGLTETRKNYYQQHYIDVPVTAGINITKHFSVDAGVQFSRLLTNKSNTIEEPYDYEANRLHFSQGNIIVNSSNANNTYTSSLRLLDTRYVAGINYQLQKFSARVEYVQGVQPLLKGYAVTNDRTKILSIKILYRLK